MHERAAARRARASRAPGSGRARLAGVAAESKRTISAAIIGNCAIAITKFVAAAITGSSAMLSCSSG